MTPLRVLFYGTSSFAVPALEALAKDARFSIVAVVTQPDRPVGRHAELTPSPVKQAALHLTLPIRQYETVKDVAVIDELKTFQPDIAVVASFGQIMPDALLSVPTHGSLNIHGSLLPKYRGSSPINAAILHGDDETGITIIKMDAKMDHGAIIAHAAEPIRPNDTASSLHDRLALLGGRIIADVLTKYIAGELRAEPQIDDKATYVKLLAREDGEIHWEQPATQVERQIRAYHPWPGCFTMIDKQRLKILSAHVVDAPVTGDNLVPGSPFVDQGKPAIVCGDGTALCLDEVQPEGKKAMSGEEFLRGKLTWGQR